MIELQLVLTQTIQFIERNKMIEIPKHEAFGLFPTLVMIFDLSENDQIEHVKRVVSKTATHKHRIMHNSESTYDEAMGNNWLDQAELSKFKDSIMICLNEYCENYGVPKLRMTNSWMNRVGKGGAVKPHRHEMSVVSGAYYPTADEGSCGLVLKSPLLPLKMNEFSQYETLYNAYDQKLPCKEGSLILFPSWLEHYTDENTTDNRVTVSFNTTYLPPQQ